MANSSKWIRIDRPFPLPAHVKSALERLGSRGHVAYVVGGCVRDFLLGKEIKDYDIATQAGPEELCGIFPDAVTVGKAFGVIKVPVPGRAPGELLEIATFREDLEYKDHRRPRGVRFSGPEEDALRRDFTINALFYDPKTSRILDVTDGVHDLKAGVIRAIGNPDERFREDSLRLLRAPRFAARFGFRIEEKTAEAIHARAKLILAISSERVRDELTLMWTGPHPGRALKMLSELGLLKHVLPEVAALISPEGDVFAHTLKTLDALAAQSPKRSPTLAWSAVLHDVGKPVIAIRTHGRNFNGHELEGARLSRSIAQRLKLSNQEIERISAIVGDHLKFKDVFQMREATLQRFIREPHFEELLALHKADAVSSDGNLAYYEFCVSRLEALRAQPGGAARLIDGQDLIQLGFRPGPEFSAILRAIEDLTLERKLQTKEEALEYVIKHFVR